MEDTNTEIQTASSAQRELVELAKKQLFYTRITSIFVIILTLSMIITGMIVVPKVNNSLRNIEVLSNSVDSQKIGQIIEDIEDITVTSQEGIEQALNSLNQVDLNALNDAIKSLDSLLRPLSQLWGQ